MHKVGGIIRNGTLTTDINRGVFDGRDRSLVSLDSSYRGNAANP
jgi:hypothetical protein